MWRSRPRALRPVGGGGQSTSSSSAASQLPFVVGVHQVVEVPDVGVITVRRPVRGTPVHPRGRPGGWLRGVRSSQLLPASAKRLVDGLGAGGKSPLQDRECEANGVARCLPGAGRPGSSPPDVVGDLLVEVRLGVR